MDEKSKMAACVIGTHVDQFDFGSEPQAVCPNELIDDFDGHVDKVKNMLQEASIDQFHEGKIMKSFAPLDIMEDWASRALA